MQAKRLMERAILDWHRTRTPRTGPEEQLAKEAAADVLAFCKDAYHLKDWVKKEDSFWIRPDVPRARVAAEVEAMFHPSQGKPTFAMAFVHEMCNTDKHGETRNSKRAQLALTGIKWAFGDWHEIGTSRVERVSLTYYLRPDGAVFADDIMRDCMVQWLNFFDHYYIAGAATPFRTLLKPLMHKPDPLRALEAEILGNLAVGRALPQKLMALGAEIPEHDAERLAYWRALPELPIPHVPSVRDSGATYRFEAVEFLLVDAEAARNAGITIESMAAQTPLPTARVAINGVASRFRLPQGLAEPVLGIIALLPPESRVFPTWAEVGRLRGRPEFDGYYFEMLGPERQRLGPAAIR